MALNVCCRRLQSYLRKRCYQQYSTGYVVLLPEIGPNIPDHNPLLKDGLPDFSDITAEKCVNTLGKNLLDFEHEVFNIDAQLNETNEVEEKKEYENGFIQKVVKPLQRPGVSLDTTWGIVKTVFITDSDKLPSARYLSLHSRAHSAQYAKFSSIPIFKASKECDVSQLSEEEQRVVEKYQLEGTLNGLDLSKSKSLTLRDLKRALHVEKTDFNKRIQVSKGLYDVKIGDPYIVRNFPANLLENMAEDGKDPTLGPWIASVDRRISDKFLEYCPDRSLRRTLWMNRFSVASLAANISELQNSSTLEKIRDYRLKLANLLGYPNYATMGMETKMAGNLENVFTVLDTLREHAFTAHKREIAELQEFANKSGFHGELEESDILYWTRKQKKSLYNFENEELREYFPFDKVLDGLIKFCEQRFGIRFELAPSVNTWHPDVKFYHIFEGDSIRPVAGFYLDPFERPEKLKSEPEDGWVVTIRSTHQIDGNSSLVPLSAVILNLPQPIYGKPSLLSYTEVQSVFSKVTLITSTY